MADLSGVWRYDTSEVLAAPMAGYVRSGPAPVAWLAFSTRTWGGADVTADLLVLGDGDQVSFQEVNDATLATRFELTAAPIDHSTWVEYGAVPVVTTATGPPRKNEDLLVLGFVTPAVPTPVGASYATVTELARVLELRSPSSPQTDAMQRCLDAATYEVDSYVGHLAQYPAPYPPLAVEVTLERAVEHWSQSFTPYGVFQASGVPILTARDTFIRHGHKLLPLKETFGIA